MTIGNIIGTIKKIKPSGRRIMKRRETVLDMTMTGQNIKRIMQGECSNLCCSIKSTEFNEDMLGRKVSNIEEFFDVIDW